jgi:hypothetical protein
LNFEWVAPWFGQPSVEATAHRLSPLRGRVKGGLRAFCSPAQRTLDAPQQRVTLKHGRQAAHFGLPAMQAQAPLPDLGDMPIQPTRFSKEPKKG